MTQNQRSYNAFLKAAKKDFGISHRQAQAMYRAVRDRLDRAPRAKDLTAHPRISREEAKRSAAGAAGRKGARAAARSRPPAPAPPTKAERRRQQEQFEELGYEIFEDPLEAEY